MKSFQYLTILLVAIVAIEAGLPGHMWTDEDWKRWEWISNADKPFEPEGTGDDGWREDGEAEEPSHQRFDLCDEDGQTGLTWDELKDCEVMFNDDQADLPTKQDFDEYDINADGIVTFEELMEIAAKVMANAVDSE